MRSEIEPNARLRSVQVADAERLFLVIDQNRSHLEPWFAWVASTREVSDTVAFIEASVESERNGTGLVALIEDEERILGVTGLHEIDATNASCNVGYWLRQDAQGRGLITRAVSCLANHAFAVLGLNRIGLCAVPHNTRSRAVAERLGFVEEGILREAEKHGDRFDDLVSYSLLRREFAAKA